MLTEDNIKNLTNLELRKELLKYQIKCGPVEASTRSIYEKKLIKHLKGLNEIESNEIVPGVNKTSRQVIRMDVNNNEELNPTIIEVNVQPQQITPPSSQHPITIISNQLDFNSLSNDEILNLLRQYNLSTGPVTSSTRNVYIKKLQKHLNNPTPVTNNPTSSHLIEDDNATVPLGTCKQEMVQPEPDLVIIEEKSTPKKPQLSSAPCQQPIVKPLEFKLLKIPQVNDFRNEETEYESFSRPTTSFSDMNRSYLRPTTDDYITPTNYELHNRYNRQFEKKLDFVPDRPLIKLSNLFDKKHEDYSSYQTSYVQNVVRQNIYSEPAPPQPIHLTELNNKQTSIVNIVYNFKYFLIVGLLVLLVFFYSLISSEPSNPIENI